MDSLYCALFILFNANFNVLLIVIKVHHEIQMGCLLWLKSYCGSCVDFWIVLAFMLLDMKTFNIRV